MQYDEVDEIRKEARVRILKEEPDIDPYVALGVGTTEQKDQYRLTVRFRTPTRDLVQEQRVRRHLTRLLPRPSRLDMQFTGPVHKLTLADTGSADDVLRIGSSVSHFLTRTGSLGFFATARENGGEPGFVSANHVIGKQDRAQPGDAVMHPGGASGGTAVAAFVRLVPLGGGGTKFVDCAFAKLTNGHKFDAALLPDGMRLQKAPAERDESFSVTNAGQSSRPPRRGLVTSFNKDDLTLLSFGQEVGTVDFDDQIEIESTSSTRRFSRPGDSGALVYNENGRAVGLLFAQTEFGGRFRNGFSYANPIRLVLDQLQVNLLT